MLLIRTLGTNFSEVLIKINTFSLKKMHLKMSSGRRQPSCLGLNVLKWLTRSHGIARHFKCWHMLSDARDVKTTGDTLTGPLYIITLSNTNTRRELPLLETTYIICRVI